MVGMRSAGTPSRVLALLLLAALVSSSCAILGAASVAAPDAPATEPLADGSAVEPSPVAQALPAVVPLAAPVYRTLRVFVASETLQQVVVLEGAPGKEFAVVTRIPVGALPHQMAVSPDGRWVAVNNRAGESTSIIDPVTMKEIARLRVGKSPHGIAWSADARTLFVAHERETYIARFEAGTWKPLPPLVVGVPQHVLTIASSRPNEMLFTVTNSGVPDHLRAVDLTTGQVTDFKVQDVHDAYYTPDQSEIWSSSSGFIGKPSDRMVIYDPATRAIKAEIHLGPGRYPFHTMKEDQDGAFLLADKSIMLLSDHAGPSLLWVDWKARSVVGETRLGQQPFHTTYDPEGARLLTTTNADGMVNVISVATRQVVQKIAVPFPHGIVSIGVP